MKKTSIYLLIAGGSSLLLLIAMAINLLRSGQKENTDFVPGIYACEAINEFCVIRDTLIIRRIGLGGNDYGITRKSAFQRVVMGKKDPPEFQQVGWPASYQPARHWLTQEGRADTILYSPRNNKMYKSGFIYQKLE